MKPLPPEESEDTPAPEPPPRKPDVWTAWDTDADRLWVATTDARSWAAADRDHDRFTVHQHGSRRLWGEIEAAYLWWEDRGSPGPERFGITVTEHTRQAWLDHPTRTLRMELP
ncbi:hypothetical protein ACPC54_04800 [Kitasatospora sp. NPDC094028]